MSISLKVIHGCNHIVTSKDKVYGKIKMRRSLSVGFPDKLPVNIEVIRVDSIENLNGEEYTKAVDFEQKVSSNIIEWINPANNPALGEEYFINALYLKIETKKFEPTECSRCSGNGWYADILSENIEIVSGKNKLAQDFIKILFTEKSSDVSYGSNIKDILAENVYDEVQLAANVTSSIDNCTYQLKKIQQELSSSGIEVSDEELLESVIVNQVLFSREECTCYINISIKNVIGETIDFTFKV